MNLDSKFPMVPSQKWSSHKFKMKLVNPANRRKYSVIVVGSGFAKGRRWPVSPSKATTYHAFATKTVRAALTVSQPKGVSMPRRITKTMVTVCIDFFMIQSKAATIARVRPTFIAYPRCLQTSSTNVLPRKPFAREYGGQLANRSFGGAQVSRTFYARGQTGQQLLLGAYSALSKQIGLGKVKMFNRHEMLDLLK